MQVTEFSDIVWDYYAKYGRNLQWRQPGAGGLFDPYKILVSEVMLQQTQVNRVEPKYVEFLATFPSVSDLAAANLSDVIRLWSGLGYNRRAKFLWQAASMTVHDYAGQFPKDQKALTKLPGVGYNTAGAICAYAYNQPVIFVETNIRTVYIHHFFTGRNEVHDNEIFPLLEQTVDTENPREWYWALMDYGSHLKSRVGNASRGSKHYVKQSIFEGSRRQLRGQVLRALHDGKQTVLHLQQQIPDERLIEVLTDLQKEGLILRAGKGYRLA